MYRSDRWPEEEPDPPRSRPPSRRNSASLSRRNSVKKEKDLKQSPLNSAPSTATSTPKKTVKPQNLDFVVTGKQILKRGDRANSLPGGYHRRQSTDSMAAKTKKPVETTRRATNVSQSSKSQETSLEDDMSLDLSQVSDFEDTNSKYGIKHKFQALATSTPKVAKNKPRSASLQSQIHSQRMETRRAMKSLDSTKQSFSYSRDSFKSTGSSPHRYGTDLDYSSVSPEYSGQSSADLSPTRASQEQAVSPRSQDLQVSSCCVSTWADSSDPDTKVEGHRCDGEWSSFWANYNNSLAKVPMKNYYDQCPTPYRTENFDLADFEISDGSRKRSPDNVEVINNIIRNQGLHLTPRETQNIIKCAHLLGNVLSKAIERRSKSDEPEFLTKKKTMTLDLKETSIPLEVKEEKRWETVTTQTDISLPNTKSAPKIFENILRQLSRSSIDVDKIEKAKIEANDSVKSDVDNNTKSAVNNSVKSVANKVVTNDVISDIKSEKKEE